MMGEYLLNEGRIKISGHRINHLKLRVNNKGEEVEDYIKSAKAVVNDPKKLKRETKKKN